MKSERLGRLKIAVVVPIGSQLHSRKERIHRIEFAVRSQVDDPELGDVFNDPAFRRFFAREKGDFRKVPADGEYFLFCKGKIQGRIFQVGIPYGQHLLVLPGLPPFEGVGKDACAWKIEKRKTIHQVAFSIKQGGKGEIMQNPVGNNSQDSTAPKVRHYLRKKPRIQFHGWLFQGLQILKHPPEIEDRFCQSIPSQGRTEQFDGTGRDKPAEDFIGQCVIRQEAHTRCQEFLYLFKIDRAYGYDRR